MLESESRDLFIRELKHECAQILEEELSRNPELLQRSDGCGGPRDAIRLFFEKKKKGRSELEEKLQEVESYLDYRVVDMEEIKNLQAMLKDLETRRSASYSFVSFSLFC